MIMTDILLNSFTDNDIVGIDYLQQSALGHHYLYDDADFIVTLSFKE